MNRIIFDWKEVGLDQLCELIVDDSLKKEQTPMSATVCYDEIDPFESKALDFETLQKTIDDLRWEEIKLGVLCAHPLTINELRNQGIVIPGLEPSMFVQAGFLFDTRRGVYIVIESFDDLRRAIEKLPKGEGLPPGWAI